MIINERIIDSMIITEPEILKSDKWGKHVTKRANGIDFHCVVKGSGPLMLMLHGFPEV